MTERVVVHGDAALHVVVGGDGEDADFGWAAVELGVGGAAGTLAMQLALLGRPPRFAGLAGADGAGDLVVGQLVAAGVDCSGVVRRGSTARVAALAADGSVRLRVQPGVRWEEAFPSGPRELDPDAWHYVPGFPGFERHMRDLGDAGRRVIADFGFAPLLADPAALERHVASLAAHVRIAVLSAAALSARTRERLVTACLGQGVAVVLATLGAEGVEVATQTERAHAPAFEVEPVNPLCAGDSFVAGFLCGLLDRRPLLEAVRFGQGTAAVRISRLAAFASRAEVDALVSRA